MGNLFIQPSFASGEVAPGLAARVDLAKYHSACKTLKNMFIHAYGGASNRPGTVFIGEALGPCRLIPFIFSTTQNYVLEFSDYKMRIIREGGFVTDAGTIVVITTPFAYADLATLKFTQSADTLFFAHPSYPPKRLTRSSNTAWTFSDISFAPTMQPPTGLAASYTTGSTGDVTKASRSMDYKVAAYNSDTGEESLPCTAVVISVEDPWVSGAKVALTWTAAANATSYNVYKNSRGYYGFIGSADACSFTDDYINPDITDGYKVSKNPFDAATHYPGAVGLYEQRLFYGRTDQYPQCLWASQTGNLYNFGTSSPLKDDDGLEFTMVSRQVNEIRHIMPLERLVILCSDSEWVATGASADSALTPTSIYLRTQGYRGSSHVPPICVGNVILFVTRAGNEVRELSYNYMNDAYVGPTLSILAGHLLEDHTITAWAFQQAPDSIVWMVRDDGKLLGLTYMKEHDVCGWHQHETNGTFEAVASIPGVSRDDVYFCVSRTLNGQSVRCIEMLSPWLADDDITQAFFMDCGLTYYGDSTPTQTISGLTHLANTAVAVLADGNVMPGLTVASDGTLTLPVLATIISVGLPYASTLETLDLDFETGQGTMQGKRKKLSSVTLRLDKTRAGWAGPDADHLTELKFRTNESWDVATQLFTGDKRLLVTPQWNRDGRVVVQQNDPLPITVLAVMPEFELGTV